MNTFVWNFTIYFTHHIQDEADDDDEWNPCKAAGVCLMLMATCCEDDIVPHILPFVTEHIKNSDWRYKDAAIMAFGEYSLSNVIRSVLCWFM